MILEDFSEADSRENSAFPSEDGPAPRKRKLHDTAEQPERVILVGVSGAKGREKAGSTDHLDELELLTTTMGGEVIEKVHQRLASIEVSTFIGKGKADYIRDRCEEADVHTVIFDDDLSPRQQRNLERMIGRKVIDRTALILNIFASHARTDTAKTQVELAQLEYMLPRLTRMWTHLSKQYGGIGTKGPGETQIETDRRIVRDRISHLKEKLLRIDRQREVQRKSRHDVTRAALIGYTNVGKSTLLNILTGAGVLVEDKLFATLDSTVRAIELGKNTVLITDTVGFIRKLPSTLVASFKSTLDEVVEADIILHVVDLSHPFFTDQIAVVEQTLKDIHADGKPTVLILNKVDALTENGQLASIRAAYPRAICISAARGINIGEVSSAIQRIIEENTRQRSFRIQPPNYKLLAEFHRETDVTSESFDGDSIRLRCAIKPAVAHRLLQTHAGLLSEE